MLSLCRTFGFVIQAFLLEGGRLEIQIRRFINEQQVINKQQLYFVKNETLTCPYDSTFQVLLDYGAGRRGRSYGLHLLPEKTRRGRS